MESDEHFFHSHIPDLLEQFLGEMEPGGRSRRAAPFPVVHGLVPFLVLELFVDIRRQRCFSQPVQDFLKDPVIMEPGDPASEIRGFQDLAAQFIAELDLGSFLELLPGLHQDFPVRGVFTGQQEHFHMSPGGLEPVEPGRDHPGVVEHQHIPGLQVFRQIEEMPVFQFPGLFVHHQQP